MKKAMFFVLACIILMACDSVIEEPVADDMFLLKSKSLSAENCENVRVQGVYKLGGSILFDFSEMTVLLEALKDAGAFNELSKYDGPLAILDEPEVTGFFGAFPIETTIAGVTGMLGSIITHTYNANDNSAGFYHLFHLFVSEEGAFVTWDHAVQSPINKKNNTAKINNKLEVLAGTGIFENATGKLINNGMIDYNTYILQADVHGRICGEGIGKGN